MADALSRNTNPEKIQNEFSSPNIGDPYFPYQKEIVGDIFVENGNKFPVTLHYNSSDAEQVNNFCVVKPALLKPHSTSKTDLNPDSMYDASTECDNILDLKKSKLCRRRKSKLQVNNLTLNLVLLKKVTINVTKLLSYCKVQTNQTLQKLPIRSSGNCSLNCHFNVS